MRTALVFAIAERDDERQLLARFQHLPHEALLECERDPAGVETFFLRMQNQALAEVAATLVQILCRSACQHDVVFHALELPVVRKRGIKRLWLVCDQLD